jgi:hypothetical protein
MKCPACASVDVISAATLWEQWIGSVSLRTSAVGIGVSGGGLGVGVGSGSTDEQTQSFAAQQLRPPFPTPRTSPYVLVVIGSVALGLILPVLVLLAIGPTTAARFGTLFRVMASLSFVGLPAAGIFQAVSMARAENAKCAAKDAEAMGRWRQLWYCMRCGHTEDGAALGRSAIELLTDIRMTLAANALQTSLDPTGAVAEAVGYQSEAAFQRAFKQRMGVTPARWRRDARSKG